MYGLNINMTFPWPDPAPTIRWKEAENYGSAGGESKSHDFAELLNLTRLLYGFASRHPGVQASFTAAMNGYHPEERLIDSASLGEEWVDAAWMQKALLKLKLLRVFPAQTLHLGIIIICSIYESMSMSF